MQRYRGVTPDMLYEFQSSPGTLAGCNTAATTPLTDATLFQSSPGTLAGCNCVGSWGEGALGVFQSSPGTLAGCNALPAQREPVLAQ